MDMTKLVLGREYYSKHGQMVAWCYANLERDMPLGLPWRVQIAFGIQTFEFDDEKDATLFALTWL